jgi:hypothetical protein
MNESVENESATESDKSPRMTDQRDEVAHPGSSATDSRAVVTRLTITCPTWCTLEPQHHADDLAFNDGECMHRSPAIYAEDTSDGPARGFGDKPIPGAPVEVYFYKLTDPGGREVATPAFHVNDECYSLEQVVALTEALTQVVAAYRAAGGVV